MNGDANVAEPFRWYRGRPRSWPFFVIATAMFAPFHAGVLIMVLFHWPRTTAGWVEVLLFGWANMVLLTLFRNPLTENAYARRLAARTDSNASGVRILYLLSVVAATAMLGALLVVVLSLLGW